MKWFTRTRAFQGWKRLFYNFFISNIFAFQWTASSERRKEKSKRDLENWSWSTDVTKITDYTLEGVEILVWNRCWSIHTWNEMSGKRNSHWMQSNKTGLERGCRGWPFYHTFLSNNNFHSMWKGQCPFALAQHTEKFWILPNVSSLCSSSVVVIISIDWWMTLNFILCNSLSHPRSTSCQTNFLLS